MEKDVKECGQLASPTEGSAVCSDNNIRLDDEKFRLLTCKILCPAGYAYPNENTSVFYCTSDVGYWYEYPAKEVTAIKECLKDNNK